MLFLPLNVSKVVVFNYRNDRIIFPYNVVQTFKFVLKCPYSIAGGGHSLTLGKLLLPVHKKDDRRVKFAIFGDQLVDPSDVEGRVDILKPPDRIGQPVDLIGRRLGFLARAEEVARDWDQDRGRRAQDHAQKPEAGQKLRKLLRKGLGRRRPGADLNRKVLNLEPDVLKPAGPGSGGGVDLGKGLLRLVAKLLHGGGTPVPQVDERRFDLFTANDPKADGNPFFSHLPSSL